MKISGIEIYREDEMLWEIPPFGGMKVPGRIYASEKMMNSSISSDEALKQEIGRASCRERV